MTRRATGPPTRAEVCAVALAECFRGDGEILANPIGTLPMIGGRLAKATFEPQLVMTDGEALLVENILPVGVDAPEKVVVGLEPVPRDVRRRVVGPAPRHDGREPDRQVRQPELRVHRLDPTQPTHAAARHARRARQHDQRQDVVLDPEPLDAGVRARGRRRQRRRLRPGRRARRRPAASTRSSASSPTSCVLDFDTPDHRMRLRSVHPGVTVDDVVAATGFELVDRRRRARDRGCRPTTSCAGSARSSTRSAWASRKCPNP